MPCYTIPNHTTISEIICHSGENQTPPYCPDEGDVTTVEVSAGDVISSFGFPENYHDNICQEWEITLDPGQVRLLEYVGSD